MDKKAYLSKLEASLKGLPESEIQDILSDYREHFDLGISEGRPPSEIAAALGEPEMIGRFNRADYMVQRAGIRTSAANMTRAVAAVVGLGIFNILFVAIPTVIAVILIFLLWVLSALMFMTGIGLLIGTVAYILFPSGVVIGGASAGTVFSLGFLLSIGFLSLGLLMLIGMWLLSRFLVQLIIRYLKFNITLFK